MGDNKDFYIYTFINDDWNGIPFFVGKGKGSRYKDLDGRSMHVSAILNRFHCRSEIIRSGLSEQEAYRLETEYKKLFKMAGMPIVDSEIISNREAQRVGIERAKAQGKYHGRKRITVDNELFETVYTKWKSGDITATSAMQKLGLKPNTYYRRVKEYEIKG